MSVALLAVALLLAARADGSKLILRIRAGNPIDKPQVVEIRSKLPAGIGTNDILRLDGLELGYDVKSEVYYVHRELELGPKDTRVFDVEIRDIWTIPDDELAVLRSRAGALTAMLAGLSSLESASELNQEIERNLELIAAYQAENAMTAGAKPAQHIRAHEANLEVLARVKKDVGRIEDFVLAAGLNPGTLIEPPPPTEDFGESFELSPDKYRIAVYRVRVRNTSPTEARSIDVRSDMPLEIKAYDILDPAGLDVATDAKDGSCYVYKQGVEIPPDGEVVYNVRIRDKWHVNGPRAGSLRTRAQTLLERMEGREAYVPVVEMLRSVVEGLAAIEAEQGPETLSSEYVAFYRAQGRRVDVLEQKINRIESAMRPAKMTTKMGFDLDPPSMKTTWLIIYIILGFLAVVSLLFFFRWYGKTKAEQLDGSGGAGVVGE